MAVYIEKYDGYIADNPNIDFERCDGEVFSYYEVNTASFNNNANSLTINGGQGAYPLAYIDTDKTLEITFESSQFTMDMFRMANAVKNYEQGDFGTRESGRFGVKVATSETSLTIPYEVKSGSVRINGFEETTATATTGKFKVTITAATESAAGSTKVVFFTGDVADGDVVRVSYQRRVVGGGKMNVKTTDTTAKGSLWAHWPVYSDGTDCTEAARKAWLHVHIFRCRATAMPGFSNSYKSASTNAVTFSAMDPKRADGKMWDMLYEPTDANGDIVAKSGATTVDWD